MNIETTKQRPKLPLSRAVTGETSIAAEAFLKAIANRHRLLLLCSLADGEASVSDLAQRLGLAQPTISQHLAKMRMLNLVTTRRDGTTIFYRIADPHVTQIIVTLYNKFCAPRARSARAGAWKKNASPYT